MRVVVPFTSLRPETAAALSASGFPHEPVEVDDGDGYHRLLSGLWAAGESFAIVEQDIVVGPGTLPDLAACPRDWCSCPYPYMNGLYAGLGCARFRESVIARHADLMDVVAGMSDEGHPPKHWCRQDGYMRAVLMQRGERQCTAHPEVGHSSRSPAHGCIPGYPPRRSERA